ncbi:hypothetical protein EDD21DRAFT_387448 [Dissophora ornata]|nr:hypothetical protein EDD21DRAFT_387448 [Dissophora ornata]
MAQCYSSAGTAPLNALANQLLGESSFSAKSSLIRSTHHHPQQQQLPPHLQQHLQHPQHQGLFPRQHLRQHQQQLHQQHQVSHKSKAVDAAIDPFEQAWSTTAPSYLHQPKHAEHHSFGPQYHHNHVETRQVPDLDLISAWEQHHQQQQLTSGEHLRKVQTTLSGTTIASHPEFSTSEFENFHYRPSTDPVATKDSVWAQEWSSQEATQVDDDDDDDEFREEWNNDHFTQAYINSHKSQFRAIEEQDRLKEARLEEERERKRQASGGPPRSAWMMAGSASAASTTVAETMNSSVQGPRRLRVPGLDSFDEEPQDSLLSVDELMSFEFQQDDWSSQYQIQHQLKEHQPQPKPVYAEDRFLSLANDIHLAEQIYYPGASSATLPELSKQSHPLSKQPLKSSTGNHSAWAQEFVVKDSQRGHHQQHTGAEWNWEKVFGKDPRRQLQLATEASKASAASAAARGESVDEGERLKAIALARLQALFGHLTLSPSAPTP